MKQRSKALGKIRVWMSLFIFLLILSGMTASPVRWKLSWICSVWPERSSLFYDWMQKCSMAVNHTDDSYPYLLYDPVKNSWVLQAGVIACILVAPLAFGAGYVRHIPRGWRLIDCLFGLISLFICIKLTNRLEKASLHPSNH